MVLDRDDYCHLINEKSLNCTNPSYTNFLFYSYFSKPISIVFIFPLALYTFVAISLLCETYFVPSVEAISEELNISNDIVGASFMAITTSAPELFVNIIGTFISDDDIGVGTIIGSATFNILIVAASIAFIGGSAALSCWAVTRDALVYLIAIGVLCLALEDELISSYESAGLVFIYFIYMIILVFNERLKKFFYAFRNINYISDIDLAIQEPIDEENIDYRKYPLRYPKEKLIGRQIWWILCSPIILIFFLTIPNCNKNRKYYLLTFLLSAVHVGLQSYIMSWCFTIIGYHLKIPISVMGLTFLAIGTNLPEMVSSIVLAKQGYGGMGVSNAIGSNTFNILICLGIPWFIRATFLPKCEQMHTIYIISSGMIYIAILLFISVGCFYLALVINKFRLSILIGFIFLTLYIVITLISIVIELNVFFVSNLPPCEP